MPPATLTTSRSASMHHLELSSWPSCPNPERNAASSKSPPWALPDFSPVYSPPATTPQPQPPTPNPKSPPALGQTNSRPALKRPRSQPFGIPLRPAVSRWEPSVPSPRPHSCPAAATPKQLFLRRWFCPKRSKRNPWKAAAPHPASCRLLRCLQALSLKYASLLPFFCSR